MFQSIFIFIDEIDEEEGRSESKQIRGISTNLNTKDDKSLFDSEVDWIKSEKWAFNFPLEKKCIKSPARVNKVA